MIKCVHGILCSAVDNLRARGTRARHDRAKQNFAQKICNSSGSRHKWRYSEPNAFIEIGFFRLYFPRAMALRLIRALPGERPLLSPLPHLPQGWADRRQGRGARTTRLRRTQRAFSSGEQARLTPQRPSPPAPTCRDDRDTSLMRHGMAEYLLLIYVIVKRRFRFFAPGRHSCQMPPFSGTCEIPMQSRCGNACGSTSTAAEEDGLDALFRRPGDSPTLPLAVRAPAVMG